MKELDSSCAARVHAGRFYKLLRQIGPIPAGIYRSEGCQSNEFYFSVGADRAIRFCLENLDSTLISQVAFTIGKARATKREEFISCYFSPQSNHQKSFIHIPHAPRLNYCVIRFSEQPYQCGAMEMLTHPALQGALSPH